MHPKVRYLFGTPENPQVKYEMEKNEQNRLVITPRAGVSVETRIQVLLEEYRALYALLTFRLTAMDRRLPAIGGALAAALL